MTGDFLQDFIEAANREKVPYLILLNTGRPPAELGMRVIDELDHFPDCETGRTKEHEALKVIAAALSIGGGRKLHVMTEEKFAELVEWVGREKAYELLDLKP